MVLFYSGYGSFKTPVRQWTNSHDNTAVQRYLSYCQLKTVCLAQHT